MQIECLVSKMETQEDLLEAEEILLALEFDCFIVWKLNSKVPVGIVIEESKDQFMFAPCGSEIWINNETRVLATHFPGNVESEPVSYVLGL